MYKKIIMFLVIFGILGIILNTLIIQYIPVNREFNEYFKSTDSVDLFDDIILPRNENLDGFIPLYFLID